MSSPDDAAPPAAAIVDWSHLLEDYLDNIGVSFSAFCGEMTGGWMFGYVEALRRARCRATIFCVSARVDTVTRVPHAPTGATICVLPAPGAYRFIRARVPNPYAPTVEEASGILPAPRRAWAGALKELAPYAATPLRALGRELRREGSSVMLCQEYENARFDACVLLGRLAGVPVFATFQGGDWRLSRLERFARPATLRSCAGLVVAATTEADRLASRYGLPPGRIARIFNPVDVDAWPVAGRAEARASLGIPAGSRVAAWHGRVEIHRKGLDVLLGAWDRVRRDCAAPDPRLLLVGTGRDAAELRRIIEARPAAGIHWVDEFVNDRRRLADLLAAADVYVFPSRHEGFPVAPMEAMAGGLPIVAADAPGVPDILDGGERSGGIIVPRADPTPLAGALARLLDDGRTAELFGARARRRAEERFSLDAVGRQLRAFLFGSDAGQAGRPASDPEGPDDAWRARKRRASTGGAHTPPR